MMEAWIVVTYCINDKGMDFGAYGINNEEMDCGKMVLITEAWIVG